MNPLMLSFDLGTQSMRAMLVDKKGEICHMVQEKYERTYFSKKPGFAEQKPEFYFDTLCKISMELKRISGADYEKIVAVCLTTIRDSILFLDDNYEPLTDVILWMDSRELKKSRPFKWWLDISTKAIGLQDILTKQYKITKTNWIIENEPEIWKKTKKVVFLSTYLNYKLTGRLVDCPANMVGRLPFDYKNRRWQGKRDVKRYMCDIPEEKLCELIEDQSVIGKITKEMSELSGIKQGLPLIATGTDKGCETIGVSVIKEHQAAISFGTTATIQFSTKKYFEPKRYLPAYPSVAKGYYNPEIQIYRGYWLISWFKKEFAAKECEQAKILGCDPEDLLNEALREIPPGCNGLILQPFWTPGVVNPNAKGAVIGFSDKHNRISIYRAIIEGIGFALMDGLYSMQKRSGYEIKELYAAGGGSRSDEICQITADMFGLPVIRIQTHEASGLGAAIAGFVAIGEFDDMETAISSMVHESFRFTPDMQKHEIYEKLYREVYSQIYPRLSPLYIKLKNLGIK